MQYNYGTFYEKESDSYLFKISQKKNLVQATKKNSIKSQSNNFTKNMHRFFSFLAIILVLTNLVKVLAFQIDSLRLVHLSSSNAAFFQANKKSVTNQNPIRKSVLTQSCHRPDITTTFLRYTNKEFSDGAEETNTKTDIPAPPPKKKSRVTRVVRSTSAGATNQVRTVVTLEELQECRNECDAKGSLMIVRFFSHWCKVSFVYTSC